MEHDHMIEALASNGTNHPLHIRSLPRRSRRGQHFLDAQVSHLFSEVQAEDCIAVTKQVSGSWSKGKASRSCCPVHCGRVSGYIEVKNATTIEC
jgi:hypothetical protein